MDQNFGTEMPEIDSVHSCVHQALENSNDPQRARPYLARGQWSVPLLWLLLFHPRNDTLCWNIAVWKSDAADEGRTLEQVRRHLVQCPPCTDAVGLTGVLISDLEDGAIVDGCVVRCDDEGPMITPQSDVI